MGGVPLKLNAKQARSEFWFPELFIIFVSSSGASSHMLFLFFDDLFSVFFK